MTETTMDEERSFRGSGRMRHEYASQADMTHTQVKINYKNEESASETWRGLDDRDDYG